MSKKYQLKNPCSAEKFIGDLAPLSRLLEGHGEVKVRNGRVNVAARANQYMPSWDQNLRLDDWVVVAATGEVQVLTDEQFRASFIEVGAAQ